MNLVALGQERFQIAELLRVKPYLVGQVQTLVDEPADASTALQAAALAPVLAEYLERLFAMLDQEPETFDLPDDPERLSYVAASVLQVGLEEKQSLLELTSTSERLRLEIDLLRRETEKLTTVLRLKPQMGKITPLDSSLLRDQISPN